MGERHRLLGCRGCGSAIVECAFALAGVPLDYEEVDYGPDSPTRARLLEVNPLGQVPAVVLPDGRVMTESLAIIHHLDDLAPSAGLVPRAGEPGRIEFLRWSVFLVGALYPTWSYGDEPQRWVGRGTAATRLREATDNHRKHLWQEVEAAARTPFFLGERMSAIDLYIAVMTRWRPGRKWFTASAPKLAAISERTSATAKVADVIARNFA